MRALVTDGIALFATVIFRMRTVQTGIGAVEVRQPQVRDRETEAQDGLGFSPSILPKYARRTKSLDALIPWLYLKGISSGDFQQALSGLLGANAPTCRPMRFCACARAGKKSRNAWYGATSRPGAICMSGRPKTGRCC